jgi:hypothetical protein
MRLNIAHKTKEMELQKYCCPKQGFPGNSPVAMLNLRTNRPAKTSTSFLNNPTNGSKAVLPLQLSVLFCLLVKQIADAITGYSKDDSNRDCLSLKVYEAGLFFK